MSVARWGGWGVVLALLACLAGCNSARSHCEKRQAFWEQGFGDDDPEATRRGRPLFVDSCTEMLSRPEAAAELKCRQACLTRAAPETPRTKAEARAANVEFSSCEATCQAPR